MSETNPPRPLCDIGEEIHAKWTKPYFGAAPYIEAMRALTDINDSYFLDSGESIVLYFLANAGSFRGPDARRIKAELKALLPK
jgi:hypothetical protein